MDVPEPWLVEAVKALHDLDNLRLADVHERVTYAEFELEAIVLTGSCVEVTKDGKRGQPPRGLQLHLGTPSHPHIVDTLVMSNLGYYQLKGSPGLWQLSVAPGKSRELFELVSSTGVTATGQQQAGTLTDNVTQVMIDSFSGKHMSLKVRKRAGKERESLLRDKKSDGTSMDDGAYDLDDYSSEEEQQTQPSGLWGSLKTSIMGKVAGGSSKNNSDDVINVFTIASGHMYERLQKIMILSVIKNTKHRVKFWIIKNYLSPHHKRIIPAMAQHYGFDYEFVTYKWPHWLHKQTDKQRLIWAYKILFLDVLFPMDVPRMIFVDSDQVVRTDLAELYHMNLKGAPVAYTPFCDNNKEMDEFRFWKGGFWANHLDGKPYHISALYLIDLKRFRQQAAGDNYRVIYEQLSKDPNSLANLDQDLPNYAQHNIPIFSLPQEWLWCESWCGNETKAKAKTIDLCNNPKTKEPKLSAARRIVPEWTGLDEEQANFTASIDARYAAEEEAFAEQEVEAAAATTATAQAAAQHDAQQATAGTAGSRAEAQQPHREEQQQQQQKQQEQQRQQQSSDTDHSEL
eukprot:jgi/Chrzof1/4386/Cz14g11070.t1